MIKIEIRRLFTLEYFECLRYLKKSLGIRYGNTIVTNFNII